MTTALATNGNGAQQIEEKSLLALVTEGDCGKLNDAQKLAYYRARCDAAGLDYRAQPFQFVKLNGKTVLYALKACSDQLAAKHGIRVHIVGQETTADGLRVVTVRAATKDGRETDDIGAVNVKGLSGEALANALMKAATKAKRRAVLSVCGLGMLDETEIESIPRAAPVKLHLTDDGAVTVDGQVTTDATLTEKLQETVATNSQQGPRADGKQVAGADGSRHTPEVPRVSAAPVREEQGRSVAPDGHGSAEGGPPTPAAVATLPPGPSKFEQLLALLDEVRQSGGWKSKARMREWCNDYTAHIDPLSDSEKATIRGAIEVCGYRKP